LAEKNKLADVFEQADKLENIERFVIKDKEPVVIKAEPTYYPDRIIVTGTLNGGRERKLEFMTFYSLKRTHRVTKIRSRPYMQEERDSEANRSRTDQK